ncbi:alpha-N-acetylgalactosaminidase-like isoform X1 [Colias croceus]|uniref:alpha-N-acetylgalactosaminidase-like isoform X1 n=1 Tax=Colias crocea TaxID=72248 RepID=UPI001E27CDA2|nr:alpha-N-acetylgalactosaminidase-like isoform X1 [Colias croceus]
MYEKLLLVSFILLFGEVCLLDNGLARKPPMGWMSWGYYMCSVDCEKNPRKCLNEQLILSIADTFYNEGYQEAGFEYIIIDDCWSEKTRDAQGRLVPDRKRFPRGMKYIADYIHSRGLKFGMYTNVAEVTCMHYPGSKGHFGVDAKMFAEWSVDYIKVDGCFVGEEFLNTAYIKFGEHLNATGRPMVYSCSWPYYIEFIHYNTPDYKTISRHCNMWRNYHDVVTSWNAIKPIINHYKSRYYELSPFHKPGQWNDMDMLIFGTGSLTESQSRVHIAVYLMLAAPLLLSCDMTRINKYEKELLLNMDLLAIGQDSLGVMGQPFELENSITLWVKPHLPRKGDKYHSVSFALVNLNTKGSSVSFTPGNYGLNSTDGYTVMDIFTRKYVRNVTLQDTISVTVPPEDVILYTLFPL